MKSVIFAKVHVTGTCAKITKLEHFTSGLAGGVILVDYDDHVWAGLSKTVVFRGAAEKDILTHETTVEIPWEALQRPCEHLWVGFYGTDSEKNMIIPTVYADLGPVLPGVDPSGDESTDPSLPVWAQLQNQIDDLKGNESPGGNGSGENGGYYTPSVKQPDSDTLQFSLAPSKAGMPAIDPVEVALPAGPKGDDYILTDADKKEIAEMAADLVEIPDTGGNVDQVSIEPAEDDIPKFFYGGALPQTKDDAVMSIRYISKTQDVSGYCETKAQGNSSMSFPKKNQTTKFYKDKDCTEKLKVDFKGWGKQSTFCFKANWIDLTQARNVVSARLWADVVKSRANYAELPELLRTSPNQGAVDGFPVKVYADGVYQGRYTLNIPKDAWMANMDKDLDTHCILCGENYVSGCFRASANINESDWTDEIHDTVPASIKTRWNQVISFVMNSTDDEFRANLNQYFYVDSLIDYYLFGLASCGLDAFGKNQLYMTYDGQKWIATMYDMDSTWGLWWNGSSIVATDYDRSEYQDFKDGEGNLLYIRLENLFYEELKTRWAELRSGALSIENIINRFERFTDIALAELVNEDYASTTAGGKFTGIPSKTTSTIQQIRSYAVARHAWCDTYVAGLAGGGEVEPDEPDVPETVPCTGITLDKTELTFDGDGTQTITATVTPSDTTDTVVWVSSAPAVASITVDGNVCTVRGVGNGNAEIVVTCGEQSASCSVVASGYAENILNGVAWNSGFINATGTINTTSNKDVYTDSFDVSAYTGTALAVKINRGTPFETLDYNRICFYDSTGTFISAVGSAKMDEYIVCAVPVNAVSARLSVNTSNEFKGAEVYTSDVACLYEYSTNVQHHKNGTIETDGQFNTSASAFDSCLAECVAGQTVVLFDIASMHQFDVDMKFVKTAIPYNSNPTSVLVVEESGYFGANFNRRGTPPAYCYFALGSRIGSLAYSAT